MNLVARLFSLVCGQANLCEISGVILPLCYRCTGLYVGAALALFLAPIRPRPSTASLWVHGILMLQMLPFGYHLIQHGLMARLITGQLFGYGLIYYLLMVVERPSSDQPARTFPARGVYYGAVSAGLLLLFTTVFYGPSHAVPVLTFLAALGFLAIVVLTAVNIVVISASAMIKIHDSKKSES